MRQAGIGSGTDLPLHVVFDAADRRVAAIDEQVRGADIPVVGQADAARVGDGDSGHFANVGAMDVAVDRDRLAERRVDALELRVGGLGRGRAPAALRAGVHQRYRVLDLHTLQ